MNWKCIEKCWFKEHQSFYHEGILRAHRYWKEVQAYHEQATTSSSAVQALREALREPKEIEEIYQVFAKLEANNWTPQTAIRNRKPTTIDVPFDFTGEPHPLQESSIHARRLRVHT
jgi:hypothetical protein